MDRDTYNYFKESLAQIKKISGFAEDFYKIHFEQKSNILHKREFKKFKRSLCRTSENLSFLLYLFDESARAGSE